MNPVLETSLRDLLTVVFKRKWGMLLIATAVVVGTVAYVMFVRDTVYEATATILVKLSQEEASPSTMFGDQPMVVSQRSHHVNSEIAILQSTQLIEQVVDDLGLDKPSPPEPRPEQWLAAIRHDIKTLVSTAREWLNEILIKVGIRQRLSLREQAVHALQQGIEVNTLPDSYVVIAALRHQNREAVALLLNEILDRYRTFRVKLYEESGSVDFFRGQFDAALSSLDEAQRELQAFEIESGITALGAQKTTLLEQIASARDNAHKSVVAANAAEAKVKVLEEEMAKDEPDFARLGSFERDSFPETLQTQLAELQRGREELRMTDLDHSIRIENNRAQQAAILRLLVSHLRATAVEQAALRDADRAELTRLETELSELHSREAQWFALERQVRVLEQDYIFNQKKLEESQAVAALEQSNVRNVEVIASAVPPAIPVGPRKTTLLAISLVCAVVAAGAWAAVAEFFDHRIFSADQLERYLGAPVAAVVPKDRGVRDWR
jgi:uncharacterized protein involved in exopolysaccharide biosynthesis